jgi:hypothetical protein
MTFDMRLALALPLLAGLLCAACAPQGVTLEPRTVRARATPTLSDVVAETNLYLQTGSGAVRLGEPVEQALAAVPAPRDAFSVNETPDALSPTLLARGWESGGEGYAVLALEGRVALVLHTVLSDEVTLRQTLEAYDRDLVAVGPARMHGSASRYWFWEQAPHRLMVCAVQNPKGQLVVTTILGERTIMDAMRANPVTAAVDDRKASELIERLRTQS